MPLGGRWHRRGEIEVIPVFTPTLIVNRYSQDFALPGEYLVVDGMQMYKATDEEIRETFVCDETPELVIATLGIRDFE